jgi:hypothetical protein
LNQTAVIAPSASAGPNGNLLPRRASSAATPATRPSRLPEQQSVDRQRRVDPGHEHAEQQGQADVAEAELARCGEPQNEEQQEGAGTAAERPQDVAARPVPIETAAISRSPTAAPTQGIQYGISQMRRSIMEMAVSTTTSHT